MATILVVDDAAFMRMRMSKILSEAGYEVIQAENGLEAVEKVEEAGWVSVRFLGRQPLPR